MNLSIITALVLVSAGAGAVVAWLLVRSVWQQKLLMQNQDDFLEKASINMKETFGSLAAEALSQNNQNFVTLAESKLGEKVTEARGILEVKERAIEGLVKPLTESLGKMDTKINELENKREGAYTRIDTVLEGMQRATENLGKGTQSLIGALKNSGTRGRYGEIGLRRVVEFAGMTEHCDFLEQISVHGSDLGLRPDMIIRLPDSKTIIVDSKTPLDAYMKIFETSDEEEQKTLLAQHVKSVRSHLSQLGSKAYWSQFPESPDYVIFYMQIESSFAAALQADPDLIEEGIRKNIIFATPTTLIALLRTISFVWQQRSIAENIEEIRDAGIELYNRTTLLLKHFGNIGTSLKTSVFHYNNAVASLESRFLPQAKKLYTLGAAYTSNVLPEGEQIELAVRQLVQLEDEETSATAEPTPPPANETPQ